MFTDRYAADRLVQHGQDRLFGLGAVEVEQKRFDRYDINRDGKITRDEYLASRRKAYAKLDTNHDGQLSFEEWAVRSTTKFAKADADHSGAMNPSEFLATKVERKAAPKCACAAQRDDD